MATPRIPTRSTRFIDPEAERMRGVAALEALRGYAGAPSQASVMHPGSAEGYESGELAGMAEMLVPGAAMAKGALGAALAGIIKPRGGNWLESGLLPVLQDLKRATYNRPEPLENESLVELFRQNEALNRWVEGPLTKYLKRDIGTEQDPVRRLFDEGVSHVPPDSLMDYRDMADADLALKRQMFDQPREPLSSGEGRYWENLTDEMIFGGPAREYMTDVSPAWMQKDPTAMVYHFGGPTWNRTFPENALGFSHITDELDNSLMGEAGGLPRKFWLTPEKMEQMGMEKAVRHVDAINKWRAEQKIAANQELANKALAVREYPDTPELPNPKGLRWVELGKDSPDLEKQLKYEGDTMGHCVGGYCPDVLEGKSRIFSLRDAKGEPHVTVEVNPAGEWQKRPGAIDENPIIKNEWPEFYKDLVGRVNGNPSPEDIATFKDYMLSKYPDDQSVASFFGPAFKIQQIKGKANKRPKDEYLPFVQDFVRNPPSGGQWSDIGDLSNTGLARFTGNSELAHMGGRFNIPPGLHSAADLRRMAKEAGVADDEIESLVSRYKFAEGGAVRIPTRGTRFIDPEAERIRGRSALEALRGYAGAPSQSSAMYPGSQEAYESGELAGMAEMLIPGAAMAKGALGAALAGVIKPRGGNWLTGSVENALKPLSRREFGPESVQQQRDALEFARNRGYSEEMIRELEQAVRQREAPAALNRWIEGPLTKYVKRDMATPEDPVRALAEQGVLHYDPSLRGISSVSDMKKSRFNEDYKVVGKQPLAKRWERNADEFVLLTSPEHAKGYGVHGIDESPWVENMPPDSRLYSVNVSERYNPDTGWGVQPHVDLGFPHLVDELNNALNPESGLPRNLLLRPEQLQQMGMEKAVRHVDAINKWRESQRVAANTELANKALVVREYPDTPELPNPKGLRWVELRAPEGTNTAYVGAGEYEDPAANELAKQLRYEGDVMGHCVGGYCPDVLEGRSRIFSLRDAKGEPHVTVEVNPMSKDDFINQNYADYADMLSEGREFADRWADKSARSKFSIAQIKGKGNSAPKDEYLPFVQDFVRNSPLGGTWDDVGDLGNARLHRLQDKSGIKYLTPEEYNLPRKKEGGPVTPPDYKFAEGGAVRAPAGNWRRMDLGGTIGYLMEG